MFYSAVLFSKGEPADQAGLISLFICNSKKLQQLLKIRLRMLGPSFHSSLKLTVHLGYRESHLEGGRKNSDLRVIIRKEIEDWLLTHGNDWKQIDLPQKTVTV